MRKTNAKTHTSCHIYKSEIHFWTLKAFGRDLHILGLQLKKVVRRLRELGYYRNQLMQPSRTTLPETPLCSLFKMGKFGTTVMFQFQIISNSCLEGHMASCSEGHFLRILLDVVIYWSIFGRTHFRIRWMNLSKQTITNQLKTVLNIFRLLREIHRYTWLSN